jgi:hypothetical protein
LRDTLKSYSRSSDGKKEDDEGTLIKYAAEAFDPWVRHQSIKNKFFEKEKNATESPMVMKYFDILYLHTGEPEG